MIQPKMEHLALPKSLFVAYIAHLHIGVLVLLAGVAAVKHIAVGHHQGVVAFPLAGANDKAFAIRQQLCHQLVQERRGVLVYIGLHIPQVVLSLLDFFAVPEGAELAPSHGIGDHICAGPEGQVSELELLRGCHQLPAGDLHHGGRPSLASGKPFPKIKGHLPPPHSLIAPMGGSLTGSPVPSTGSSVMLATRAINGSVFRLFGSILA